MKKLFILIFLLLFVTGCDVKYKITINEDKTVDEEITAYGLYSEILVDTDYTLSYEEYLQMTIDSLQTDPQYDGYEFSIISKDEDYKGVRIFKKHKNLAAFSSPFTNTLFNDTKINTDKNNSIIKTDKYIGLEFLSILKDMNIDVSITSYYQFKTTNTANIDLKTNTHNYNYKIKGENKEININFINNKKYSINSIETLYYRFMKGTFKYLIFLIIFIILGTITFIIARRKMIESNKL